MPEQNRPASPEQAPDPASSYERAKPTPEPGKGGNQHKKATPTHRPDRMEDAVKHKQPSRQINADDDSKA